MWNDMISSHRRRLCCRLYCLLTLSILWLSTSWHQVISEDSGFCSGRRPPDSCISMEFIALPCPDEQGFVLSVYSGTGSMSAADIISTGAVAMQSAVAPNKLRGSVIICSYSPSQVIDDDVNMPRNIFIYLRSLTSRSCTAELLTCETDGSAAPSSCAGGICSQTPRAVNQSLTASSNLTDSSTSVLATETTVPFPVKRHDLPVKLYAGVSAAALLIVSVVLLVVCGWKKCKEPHGTYDIEHEVIGVSSPRGSSIGRSTSFSNKMSPGCEKLDGQQTGMSPDKVVQPRGVLLQLPTLTLEMPPSEETGEGAAAGDCKCPRASPVVYPTRTATETNEESGQCIQNLAPDSPVRRLNTSPADMATYLHDQRSHRFFEVHSS